MALDGLAIYNIKNQLEEKIIGGRIDKIHQPEKDEIVILIRNQGENFRLLLTGNSSYPRIHFTEISKENPKQAPQFSMMLRKHLISGKIIKIEQPFFDRILNIVIEGYNELGDLVQRKLIIEIMGRHSNIILIDENEKVLESIKRVPIDKSSVRPILPGVKYSFPPNNKLNPLNLNKIEFLNLIKNSENEFCKNFIYKNYNGISPILASEICFRKNIAEEEIVNENLNAENLFDSFYNLMENAKNKIFVNEIIYNENNIPLDFSSTQMTLFENNKTIPFDSVSKMLESFYEEKDIIYRVNQKTSDLRKLLENNIDRCNKKSNVFNKTLDKIKNRNEIKLKGELITANIYSIKKGDKELIAINYYDENLTEVIISLDENLTPSENAQKYFKKYNKYKRTSEALKGQIIENQNELEYLNSVLSSFSLNLTEQDINEIRNELTEENYIKYKKQGKNKKQPKSKPMHFISSDGFHIYVGKNNVQNDELTLKFANNKDIWLHTKYIHGSHVIIRTENNIVPESTLLEAGNLAAYFSQGKTGSNIPVDYVEKKYVKKPSGGKPGMVIYESNKTIFITPNKDLVFSLDQIK